MIYFNITAIELIGWIIIYIVGLICVACGLGSVIHAVRMRIIRLERLTDNLHQQIDVLHQWVEELEDRVSREKLGDPSFQDITIEPIPSLDDTTILPPTESVVSEESHPNRTD